MGFVGAWGCEVGIRHPRKVEVILPAVEATCRYRRIMAIDARTTMHSEMIDYGLDMFMSECFGTHYAGSRSMES